jgi:hypothetical protein
MPSASVSPALTFFDDERHKFLFSPHAKGKGAIFLLAIGKPRKSKPQQASSGP